MKIYYDNTFKKNWPPLPFDSDSDPKSKELSLEQRRLDGELSAYMSSLFKKDANSPYLKYINRIFEDFSKKSAEEGFYFIEIPEGSETENYTAAVLGFMKCNNYVFSDNREELPALIEKKKEQELHLESAKINLNKIAQLIAKKHMLIAMYGQKWFDKYYRIEINSEGQLIIRNSASSRCIDPCMLRVSLFAGLSNTLQLEITELAVFKVGGEEKALNSQRDEDKFECVITQRAIDALNSLEFHNEVQETTVQLKELELKETQPSAYSSRSTLFEESTASGNTTFNRSPSNN